MAVQEISSAHGIGTAVSRRAILGAIAVTPAAALPLAAVAAPGRSVLISLAPSLPALRRTRAGRALSRVRYHNAEGFLPNASEGPIGLADDAFYRIGIALHLGLTAHLLDVGFDDDWNAHNIGLNLGRALDLANATGLDCRAPDVAHLAASLSPYGRWRNPGLHGERPTCPFDIADAHLLTRMLLDRVREATGHPRPRRA